MIDGLAQEITTGVIHSESWLPYTFNLTKGAHSLEWVYKKINEHDISEDLSAEISYIEIRGIKSINKECQTCIHGVSDVSQSRCLKCEANQYLETSSDGSHVCKECPEDSYSPNDSIGISSCLKRLPCKVEDFSVSLGECKDHQRMLNFAFL